MSRRKITDKPYSEVAFENFGSVVGGALVGMISGATSTANPIGMAIGTVLGATTGFAIGRHLPFDQLRPLAKRLVQYRLSKMLLKEKFESDLQKSFVVSSPFSCLEIKEAIDRLYVGKALSQIKDVRFSSIEGWGKLPRLENEEVLGSDASLLSKYGGISVNISCINVGSYAALASVQSRYGKAFGLQLDISYHALNGREQMQTLFNQNKADFIIVPIDDFTLCQDQRSENYRALAAVNWENQYVFRKKMHCLNWQKAALIHTLTNSAAEMHRRLGIVGWGKVQEAPIDDVRQIPALANDLAGGDYIVAWDPLSNILHSSSDFDLVPGSFYRVSYFLFCHKSWLRPHMTRLRRSFMRLFQSEWEYCSLNKRVVLKLISKDKDFMSSYATSCGLIWTNEIG
jgi:hypothetical protein